MPTSSPCLLRLIGSMALKNMLDAPETSAGKIDVLLHHSSLFFRYSLI